VLVYPRIEQDIDISYRVNGVTVRIITVDLSVAEMRDMFRVAKVIAEYVAD
jgi:hypothetical protein